jgi:hypothetical protein
MASLTDRMMRAAKLDVSLYEEVEADEGAMGQAMTAVVLSSVAAGIGTFTLGGIGGVISGVIGALLGWFVWSFLIYLIGTKLLPEPQTSSSYGELLRTLGFASSPGVMRVLGIIPLLGGLFLLAAAIWMLISTVIAVRQALDYQSTLRAVGVCLIGWIVMGIVMAIFLAPFVAKEVA